MKLAENSLTVAESLRGNYFNNTAEFVRRLRQAIHQASLGKRPESPLTIHRIGDVDWSAVQGELVTFIDGGVGQVQISGQVPVLLRVGSYSVRTGERRLAEREQFGYYPVILGDLQGGSKERKDFVDIVRITAELLGGLSALMRTPDLDMLMFHGPLVYTVRNYMGHSPFTENDIDTFLNHYAPDHDLRHKLKEDFLLQVRLDIYPRMTDRAEEWSKKRLFEPLAWMSYLLRCLIQEARKREPTPLIVGVVERGTLREFCEKVLLERVFRGLRKNEKTDYFNEMYGRTDLTSPRILMDRLGYNDTLLLRMLMTAGDFSESWVMSKEYDGLRRADVSLPGEAGTGRVDFSPLRPGEFGFPLVRGCYVQVNETTEPIRIEVFEDLGEDQIMKAARRVYLYSRLLPGYGFPVGLDIADKHAHIPAWLTEAYGKLIRHHLGVSLQRGEISDAEMRRVLVRAIYMTHRDWLFRPSI